MAQERSVIKFIRPCLSIHEDKKILTSEYCWQSLNKKRGKVRISGEILLG